MCKCHHDSSSKQYIIPEISLIPQMETTNYIAIVDQVQAYIISLNKHKYMNVCNKPRLII